MKKNQNKQKKKQSKSNEQEKINLSNEIIIGLTPKKEENKNINKKNKSKTKKIDKEKKTKPKTKNKIKKINKKTNKKSRKSIIIIKWTTLIVLIILTIVLFLNSSLFNIREIEVENNSKISQEEIIKLSTLEKDVNMFKYSNRTIRNNIKTNAYIEDVKIKRSLNGYITLTVTERKPTFMLKFANSYVYINNQGYILELSETPLELPTIIGYKTIPDEIKEGNRLIVEDLEKLDDVIKIINSAKESSIFSMITSIDITDKNNYKIELASKSKTVQFGTATNINVKLLKIQEVLENEEGVAGEIYFQDSERTIFKENV